MITMKVTEEQKKDFNKSLIERIKAFFKEVFHSEKPLHGKELDEHFLSKATSEEEKETLSEVFDEIDIFYEKQKAYRESGMDLRVWYDEEIVRIVKGINPDITQTEIDQVKEALAARIDGEIELTGQALEKLDSLIREVMEKEGKE